MVVEVFIAECDPEHPLPNERAHAVLDEIPRPSVLKADGEPIDEADSAIRRSQKQAARVRGDRAPVEIGRQPPSLDRAKQVEFRAILCRHRGTPPSPRKSFKQNNFR